MTNKSRLGKIDKLMSPVKTLKQFRVFLCQKAYLSGQETIFKEHFRGALAKLVRLKGFCKGDFDSRGEGVSQSLPGRESIVGHLNAKYGSHTKVLS